MNSTRRTQHTVKQMVAAHERRIKQIKSKISHGKYQVTPEKLAKAFCVFFDNGAVAIRAAEDVFA